MKFVIKIFLVFCLLTLFLTTTIHAQEPELVVQQEPLIGINALDFSPDGKLLASGRDDGSINIWDFSTGELLRTLADPLLRSTYVSMGVVFGLDGKTVVSLIFDGYSASPIARIWDIHTGKIVSTFISSGGLVDISPKGYIAARTTPLSPIEQEFEIKVWDIRTGKEVQTFTGRSDNITSLVFVSEDELLAIGRKDEKITLWNVRTGEELQRLTKYTTSRMDFVALSQDGQLLANYWLDMPLPGETEKKSESVIKFWDLRSGKEFQTVKDDSDLIFARTFSPDGSLFASSSLDNKNTLWEVAAGKKRFTFHGHAGNVAALTFHPQEELLVSGGDDGTIKLWDLNNGKELGTLYAIGASDWAIVTPDSLFDVSPGARQFLHWVRGLEVIEFFRLRDHYYESELFPKLLGFDQTPLRDISQHSDMTLSSEAEDTESPPPQSSTPPPKTEFATTDMPEDVTPELVVQTGHTGEVSSVVFSPNGKLIASHGRGENIMKLWDVASGKELRTLRGHSEEISGIAFHPNGHIIASCSLDGTMRLWEVLTGKELAVLTGHTGHISTMAFSPNGEVFVSGSIDSTIKFWDVQTGKELRTLTGHLEEINALAFSPDNRLLLSSSRGSYGHGEIKLWDLSTGKIRQTLTGYWGAVAFSPDGQIIAGCSVDSITLWDVQTGKKLRTLKGHVKPIRVISFSPDGDRLVSGSYDNTTNIWDIRMGHVLRTFPEPFMALRPNGGMMAARGEQNTIMLRDLNTGELLQTLSKHAESTYSVAFSPDGAVLSGAETRNIRQWDLKTGVLHTFLVPWHFEAFPHILALSADYHMAAKANSTKIDLYDVRTGHLLNRLEGHTHYVTSAAFSPDNRLLASYSHEAQIKLWDIQSGKEIRTMRGTSPLLFSPQSDMLVYGSQQNNTMTLWDVRTGNVLCTFPEEHLKENGEWWLPTAKFSPDGTFIASSLDTETIMLWDVETGKKMRTFTPHSEKVDVLAFSPDGRVLAGGKRFFPEFGITVWDVATGKVLHTLARYSAYKMHSLSFTSDSSILASAYENDPRILLWDVQSGKQIATIIFLDEHDWAVVTPHGQFDASPGAMKLMYFVVGLEPIELDQLKERYYEPGLLQKLLGFSDEPLRDVPAFEGVKLYPDIEWLDADPTDATVRLRLKNRGGGIGKVVVLINGKEVAADARGAKTNPDAQELELEIDLKDHPFLIPGEQNTIEVKAWNAEGYLVSRGLSLEHDVPKRSVEQVEQVESPHLWTIVAGVSDYQGGDLDLQFAAKDAENMATALQLGAKRLFGAEQVHLTLLTSPISKSPFEGGTGGVFLDRDKAVSFPSWEGQGVGSFVLPTRKNLVQAFDAAKDAKSTDVLVVYLAGHGVNHGGQDGDYYYLTSDARIGTLDDPAVRSQTAISSQELTELIKQIPALKQVLILDTCMSGRVVEKLTEQRTVPSSQIRALERMKDRMGLHILAGSAADAVSYEASRYGQGLLTYSLLLGMQGAALREEEFVDISHLFAFAADQVPELAKDIGGIQRPVVATPRGGSSFDIGRLTSDDTPQIPLAKVRPLVLRVNFQDEMRFRDHLGLTKYVNDALREMSARGQEAPLVFIDALEFPEAYLLAGRYRVNDDNITVSLLLFRGEEEVAQFVIAGDTADMVRLSHEISRTLEKEIAGAQ